MTTKENEQKALDKIKKIVHDLGPNSYVGEALKGCLDCAQTNIDCDFMDSYYDSYEYEKRKNKELEAKIDEEKSRTSESNDLCQKLREKISDLESKGIPDEVLETVKMTFKIVLNSLGYAMKKSEEYLLGSLSTGYKEDKDFDEIAETYKTYASVKAVVERDYKRLDKIYGFEDEDKSEND